MSQQSLTEPDTPISPFSHEKVSPNNVEKNFDVELDFESDLKENEKEVFDKNEGDSEDKNENENDDEEGICDDSKEEGEEEKTEEKEEKKEDGEGEEGEDNDDDGELSEDGSGDELEEGELKEEKGKDKPNQQTRQICRFFNKGRCTFGDVCRFLHLTNGVSTGKGNYSMFPPTHTVPAYPASTYTPNIMDSAVMKRSSQKENYFMPAPVGPLEAPSPLECAWEKGLREAKELVKKAHLRRGASPDFDQKKLNLSLSDIYVPFENDKQSERDKKKERERTQSLYEEYMERENFWKRENFEIRYRDNFIPYREKLSRTVRRDSSMDRDDKLPKGLPNRFDSDRRRAEEWFDPYRRSKSPKGGRRSRSRSIGSYSSVSSYSERSSMSYSRSPSSASSCDSSRSPSPKVLSKRKSSDSILSPKSDRYSKLRNSGKRHARSRRESRSTSHSLSRSSSSNSLSMDSISSTGNSSNGSLHGSTEMINKKDEIKSEDETKKRAKELFEKLQFLKKDKRSETAPQKVPSDIEDPVFDHGSSKDAPPTFPSLQHLLPNTEKEKKEPMKKPPQKQQIKLTLINKNEQPKFSSMPKELDTKSKLEDKSSKNTYTAGKRPLSPPSPGAHGKPPTNTTSKKSASSRRDELLKQLKAVEDAIARKRAKFC